MRKLFVFVCIPLLLAASGCGKATKVHQAKDYSELGDLSEYRKIAEDTLAIVEKNDLPAAKTRIKDLETAWDKAEATMKPKNEAAWTSVDKSIDHALAALRNGKPDQTECSNSLKALIVKLSKAEPGSSGTPAPAPAPAAAAK